MTILPGSFVYANTFGATPSRIENQILYPGNEYTTYIQLSRSDISSDHTYYVSVSGEATDFISLPVQDVLTIPSGTEDYVLPVHINIPTTTQVGEYNALVIIEQYINGGNSVAEQSGSLVTPAVAIPIRLQVQADRITEYSVPFVTTIPTSENQPGFIFFRVHNEGNQVAGPESIRFSLKNIGAEKEMYSDRIELEKVEITEFTQQLYVAPFDHELPIGSYWLFVEFLDGEDIIGDPIQLSFNIENESESVSIGTADPIEYSVTDEKYRKHITATSRYTNQSNQHIALEIISTVEKKGEIVETVQEYIPVAPAESVTPEQHIYVSQAGEYVLRSRIQVADNQLAAGEYVFSISGLEAMNMQEQSLYSSNLFMYMLFGLITIWVAAVTTFVYYQREDIIRYIKKKK